MSDRCPAWCRRLLLRRGECRRRTTSFGFKNENFRLQTKIFVRKRQGFVCKRKFFVRERRGFVSKRNFSFENDSFSFENDEFSFKSERVPFQSHRLSFREDRRPFAGPANRRASGAAGSWADARPLLAPRSERGTLRLCNCVVDVANSYRSIRCDRRTAVIHRDTHDVSTGVCSGGALSRTICPCGRCGRRLRANPSEPSRWPANKSTSCAPSPRPCSASSVRDASSSTNGSSICSPGRMPTSSCSRSTAKTASSR